MTIWPVLVDVPLMVPLIGAMFWGASQIERSRRRKLQLDEKGIRFTMGSAYGVRWRKVMGFRFEPAGTQAEFTRLSVQYGIYQKERQQWGMIMDATQREMLLSELARRRDAGSTFDIVEVDDVAEEEPKREFKVYSLPIWLAMLSFILFFNALPLLMAGLLPPEWLAGGDQGTKLNPKIIAWIQHFHSRAAFRHAMAIMGAILFAVAAGCFCFPKCWNAGTKSPGGAG